MANHTFPKISAFTANIPFNNPYTELAEHTVTGPLTLTIDSTGAQGGNETAVVFVADGVNVPDVSAFSLLGTNGYVNTAGKKNLCVFSYVGGQYLYTATPITAGAGDTTAPTVVSASVTDATHIQIVFSESVTATTAGWSFKKNGSALAITSVSGSGNTWTFLVASMSPGDTIQRTYTTGATVDGSSNQLASFTDQAVTNTLGDVTAPSRVSQTVENATPSRVDITYDEALNSGSVPATGDFAVLVNTVSAGISSVAIVGAVVQITLSTPIVSGDDITVSYVGGTNKIKDIAGNNAANFSGVGVTNNVGGATDADATNYINYAIAQGETVSTPHQTALHTFFAGLKTDGIWPLITQAIIGVWTTPAACGRNIKGASFPATIPGTWTLGGTSGMTPDNGTPGESTVLPSTDLLQNDISAGVYTLNASQTNTYDSIWGSNDGTHYLQNMTSGGDVYMNVNGPQNNAGPLALAAAFSFVDRSSSTQAKMVRNGSVVLTDTTTSTGLPTVSIKLGASTGYFSNRPFWFWFCGKSMILAGVEAAFNTRVQTLKTDFGV
jgi:hypothetical protein